MKEYKHQAEQRKKYLDRGAQKDACYAALKECETKFNNIIRTERARAQDLIARGYPIEESRQHIRDAAIGLLVVDRAIIDLKGIPNDDILSGAVNMLGSAIRQMKKLNKTAPAISNSARKSLQETYMYPLDENVADTDQLASARIPEEMVQKINKPFVDALLNGASFSECLGMSLHSTEASPEVRSEVDELFNSIPVSTPTFDKEELSRIAMDHAKQF